MSGFLSHLCNNNSTLWYLQKGFGRMLGSPSVAWINAGMDGGRKRKEETTKARKAGAVLPDCPPIPISWLSEALSCAARHKYMLYRAQPVYFPSLQ